MKHVLIMASMCITSWIGAMDDPYSLFKIQIQNAQITPKNVLFVSPDTREYLNFTEYVADIRSCAEAKTNNSYQQSIAFIETLMAGFREKAKELEHAKLWQFEPEINSHRNQCIFERCFEPLDDSNIQDIDLFHMRILHRIHHPSFATRHTISKLVTGCGLVVAGTLFAASVMHRWKAPQNMTRWDWLHIGRAFTTVFCGFFALASGWNEQYRIQQRVNNQFFQLLALLHTNRENADAIHAEQQRNTLEI